MFDKYRERWNKLEEDHETVRAVKAHVEKYQVVYACGATMIVSVILTRQFARPTVITNVIEHAAPVINNNPVFNNDNSSVVNLGGYARKIVRCLETDEMWPSMSKAAEAMGVSLALMSSHIHGRHDHVNDLHFVIEGLAA